MPQKYPVFMNPLEATTFDQRRDWHNLMLAEDQLNAQRYINAGRAKPEPIWFATLRVSYANPVQMEADAKLAQHLGIHVEKLDLEQSDDKGKWQLRMWVYCGLDRRIERPEENRNRFATFH